MKVNLNLQTDNKKINFEGYKHVKSDKGFKEYEFNFPFDSNNYDCYLEIFAVDKEKNNYKVDEHDILANTEGADAIKLKPGVNRINLAKDYYLHNDVPFAYHYKLIKKGTDIPTYRVDAGAVIDYANKSGKAHEIYNIVVPTESNVTKGGAMKLVLPDSYNLGWVYDDKNNIVENKNLSKAKKSVKNFSNKIGGSLAGIEKDIELGKFDGFSRIVSTPIFTDDSLTAHAYWNRNCMQTALSLGNINNYTSLQKKLFGKGINFVSDGAFVNEGLEGIHFKHVLKYGKQSPYFQWFRVSGLSDSPLTLGVFAKNKENIAHRIVNPEYFYKQEGGKIVKDKKNPNWDENKPTYFQIYDKRLVDVDKLDPQKPIEEYNSTNMLNALDINTHNDTVVPYKFEIKNSTYDKNIKELNEYNKHAPADKKIKYNSPMAAKVLSKFETFELEGKNESGFETWDANPDIAKLNYLYSHTDTQRLKESIDPKDRAEVLDGMKETQFEVQDYAITSGLYWTKKTAQILNLNAAQNLKNINGKDAKTVLAKIQSNIQKGIFPQSLENKINEKVVENVLNGKYQLKGAETKEDYKDLIISGLMDVPLDSIEVGDDISAVLGSPYITKRARNAKELGVSRYELFKSKKQHIKAEYEKTYNDTNKLYTNQMYAFADEILDAINEQLPEDSKLYNGTNATTYGKYVLPLLTAEIAKFAVIKSVNPKAEMNYNKDNGEISYKYKDIKQTTLRDMGIIADSPKQEAKQLISKLSNNINNHISSKDKKELATALLTSIKGTDAKSFELAEMIVDRAEAGLDWRIDATKDIGDIESLRNGKTPFDFVLKQSVSNFWKSFAQSVIKENENTYIAAEITDEMDNVNDNVVKNFLLNTGITTIANYRYFFNGIPEIFAKNFENANNIENNDGYIDKRVFETMIGDQNYLRNEPLNSLLYSYTFIGNHDKPRALHCLALDINLFMTKNSNISWEAKEKAYRIMKDKAFGDIPHNDIENYNYSRISFKNIAMCESLQKGFGDTLNYLEESGKISSDEHKRIFEAVNKSIADIANGKYKDKNFEKDAFGVKPFDVTIELVLEQAKKNHGLNLSKDKMKWLKDETFETIIDPAISRLLGIMKFMVALPGNPTMFAGDDLGATGYEEKTKNMYLQNRSYLHHEWVNEKDDDYKPFIAKHKKELDELMTLRSKPELHALNDGAPFTLGLQKAYDGTNVSAMLRQSTDGAMAITLFNASGVKHDFKEYYKPHKLTLGGINLDDVGTNGNIGLRGGLKHGTIFRNAKNKNEKYEVVQEGDHYYIRKAGGGDIEIEDTTLILYSEPEKEKKTGTSAASKHKDTKGKGHKILYNPQYNIVSNPYTQTQKAELGSKLQLTCR